MRLLACTLLSVCSKSAQADLGCVWSVCTGFECYITRYITINMTAKKVQMPRYIAFWSLDITDYISIKTDYVHILIEIYTILYKMLCSTFKRLCCVIH